MHRAKQDDEWGRGQKESQGHGAGLGDWLLECRKPNLCYECCMRSLGIDRLRSGKVFILQLQVTLGKLHFCWQSFFAALLKKKERKKSHPVKEHFCWYVLIHTRGFCWHSYAGCRSHFSAPLIDVHTLQHFVMLIQPRSVLGERESEDQARRVREQKSREVFVLQPSREWVMAERKST